VGDSLKILWGSSILSMDLPKDTLKIFFAAVFEKMAHSGNLL
jgi:hypothetical protein